MPAQDKEAPLPARFCRVIVRQPTGALHLTLAQHQLVPQRLDMSTPRISGARRARRTQPHTGLAPWSQGAQSWAVSHAIQAQGRGNRTVSQAHRVLEPAGHRGKPRPLALQLCCSACLTCAPSRPLSSALIVNLGFSANEINSQKGAPALNRCLIHDCPSLAPRAGATRKAVLQERKGRLTCEHADLWAWGARVCCSAAARARPTSGQVFCPLVFCNSAR